MFAGAEPLGEICRDARIYLERCQEVDDRATVRLLGWQIDRISVLMGELETMTANDFDRRY